MGVYRYSNWDGRQDLPDLDKDALLSELEGNLTAFGDLATALWKMQREGINDGEGGHIPGNRELYQKLEDKKRELFDRYDITPAARALRRQLEKIGETEELPDLPQDIESQVEALKRHRFSSPEAEREFQRLLEALRNNSLEALGGAGDRQTRTGLGRGSEAGAAGKEPVSLGEALRLLSLQQKMDRLEAQLRQDQRRRSLEVLDTGLVGEVLGEDYASAIERLRKLDVMLSGAGYIREAADGLELTPRAIRRIGQKALEEIYARIKRDRSGNHAGVTGSAGGMKVEETKKYEFGDDFNLHILNTVMNTLRREPRKPPLTLAPDDFETMKTEPLVCTATALLLDLSRSMPRHGNFQAAKRVALALTELIRTRYPTDSLHIIGFSTWARQIASKDLPVLGWDNRDRHTNIQHALWLARRLLAHEANASKQIMLVTDGEPTAHIENGQVSAKYPPTERTRLMTLAEVRNCTEDGITINAFIFEGAEFTEEFINGLARINRGRVFFTNAQSLGRYVLMDYVARRSRVVQ
jgi:uncharacterized protein with von Willebrand factor type A (vWA) domain